MKKIILFAFIFFIYFLNAQKINDIALKEINTQYIGIKISSKLLSNKLYVFLDYGQPRKSVDSENLILKDDQNKVMQFNSEIEIFNFFFAYGYKLSQLSLENFNRKDSYYDPKYILEKIN